MAEHGPWLSMAHGAVILQLRNKLIFGTGASLDAVTATSNMRFVRACQSRGLRVAAHVHPARSLTGT